MAATTPVWIVVVIVVAAAVGGIGFYAGYEYRGSPAATGTVANNTLSIGAAGTLTITFPELASALVNETPGISAPLAAQDYEGSLDVTSGITSQSLRVDVAALADFRLAPQLLYPTYANYEVVFAQTQEVLIYNASLPAYAGIDSANWAEKLATETANGGSARLGIWNASTDPNGYNEIFSLMLQGQYYGSGISDYYSDFYSGAPGSYATPNPSTTILEHESHAASLIETGVVSAVITYKAVAIQNHLPYVLLDPIVGLGSNNSTALTAYAGLPGTQILSSSGALATVHPAPILFAATVPLNAQNAALGLLFLHLLLSPQGSAILAQGGAWTPIFPGWTDQPSKVPGLLAPDVTGLPAWATPFLT
ncbi:MAG TPA: substrate-binding domain-containing protein [Thermoplasmata archaeon]|nr:substrate-binding domain-containing protein [Thermoplasmata archaeon]